ncbi:MAG: hypothetical protein U0Y68_21600 [Blastocatellia bacterium]
MGGKVVWAWRKIVVRESEIILDAAQRGKSLVKVMVGGWNRTRMTRMVRIFADLIRVNPRHPRHPRSIVFMTA